MSTSADSPHPCDASGDAELHLRALTDVVQGILWSTDSNGNMIWHNRKWLEYTGQTEAEAAGEGWRSALHPEDFAETCKHYEPGSETRHDLEYEGRIRDAQGRYRWFLTRATPECDADGKVLRWFGCSSEIDRQKAVEASLAATEERLRTILESALEHAIIAMDVDRTILSWNVGAEGIFGYTRDEVVGKSCDLIFTEEDRAAARPQEEATKALRVGRAADNRWHERKDGSRFWAQGVMLPMKASADGPVTGLLKILSDETEAKRSREALAAAATDLAAAVNDKEAARCEAEAAREAAEAAGKAKDHFLAVLSHELRTPLTPALMATSMLLRQQDLTQDMREALEMVQRNIQLEAHFVNDLLDITRIANGKMPLSLAPIDLHSVIEHAVTVCTPDITAKQQSLSVTLDAPLHHLPGDAARLQQVVWNLLKNASKFTPKGEAIGLRTFNDGSTVQLEVRDSGIGIDAEGLGRIFDPFIQANDSITRDFGGLGLGLAISKAVVDAHGGTLTADSQGLGTGTTFTVSLPLQQGNQP